jgi:T5SS/PEP-CTERM-associated repeat protein
MVVNKQMPREHSRQRYLRRIGIAAAINAAFLASWAHADNVPWLNPAGGSYQDLSNWGGSLPTASDTLLFNLGSPGYTVTSAGAVQAGNVVVRNDTVVLDAGGGQLALDPNATMLIADAAGQTAAFTFQNGMLTSGSTTIGGVPGSVGNMTITGPGSAWQSTYLYVGNSSGASGAAQLSVLSGAQVGTSSVRISGNQGQPARIEVSGAGSQLLASGWCWFGPAGPGELTLSNGGSAVSGQNIVSTPNTLTVTSNGYVLLTNGSTLHGNMDVRSGGLLVSESGCSTVDGNLTLIGGNRTSFFLGGPSSANSGQIAVTGQATLGGTLELDCIGYVPQDGDTFKLFDATSISGSFSTITVPHLPSTFRLNTDNLYTTGNVSFVDAGMAWAAASDGAWEDGSRWAAGQVPSLAKIPLFDKPGTYRVTLGADQSVSGLVGRAGSVTFDLQSHTLSLLSAGNMPYIGDTAGTDASVSIVGGGKVLASGTVTIGSSGTFRVSGSGTQLVGTGGFDVSGSCIIESGANFDVHASPWTQSVYSSAGSLATLNIRGNGSHLSGGYLWLQASGAGSGSTSRVVVEQGATAQLTNYEELASNGCTSELVVQDPGSALNISSVLDIGYWGGTSSVTIANGGVVRSVRITSDKTSGGVYAPNSSGIIGSISGSTGAVMITDPGSQWIQDGTCNIGLQAIGTLTIQAGGAMQSQQGHIARFAGSSGDATVSGAGSSWSMSDALFVGGDAIQGKGGTASLKIRNGGSVTVANRIDLWDTGTIDVTGGGRMLVGAGDITSIASGTLRVGAGGTLAGTGTIVGDVINDGGIVSPGHSPGTLIINGNYIQTAGGTLLMEISGAGSGQYDVLQVTGSASAHGTLQLVMLGGFLPQPGQTFQFFDIGSSGAGVSFDQISLPPGVSWDTSSLNSNGTISVVPEPGCLALLVLATGSLLCRRRRQTIVAGLRD